MKKIKNLLKINGSDYLFTKSLTILELMEYLGFNKRVIVIDYNGTILDKTLWEKIFLKNMDCLEILSIAGGG
jgi:thiamine biosynthesis protein ThiS